MKATREKQKESKMPWTKGKKRSDEDKRKISEGLYKSSDANWDRDITNLPIPKRYLPDFKSPNGAAPHLFNSAKMRHA